MKKKLDHVFRMSQIIRDSRFDDLPLSVIDGDRIDLVSHFETDESTERAVDVVSLARLLF